jgi:hypothetical protein
MGIFFFIVEFRGRSWEPNKTHEQMGFMDRKFLKIPHIAAGTKEEYKWVRMLTNKNYEMYM